MSSLIGILALGGFALIAMLWPLWQKRADRGLGVGVENDDVAALWEKEKDRLLLEQVELDSALAEGKISSAVHLEERTLLMSEAERALKRLRQARSREERLASAGEHTPRIYPVAGGIFAVLTLIATMVLVLELKGLDITRQVKQAEAPKIDMAQIRGMVARLEARVQNGESSTKEQLMLARSYFVLGERDKSLALYMSIHENDAQNMETIMALGEIYFGAKAPEEQAKALGFFDKALAIEPAKVEALWFKSLALVRQRKFDDARAVLVRLRDVAKDNKMAQDAIKRLLEELDKNITAPETEKGDEAALKARADEKNKPAN